MNNKQNRCDRYQSANNPKSLCVVAYSDPETECVPEPIKNFDCKNIDPLADTLNWLYCWLNQGDPNTTTLVAVLHTSQSSLFDVCLLETPIAYPQNKYRMTLIGCKQSFPGWSLDSKGCYKFSDSNDIAGFADLLREFFKIAGQSTKGIIQTSYAWTNTNGCTDPDGFCTCAYDCNLLPAGNYITWDDLRKHL